MLKFDLYIIREIATNFFFIVTLLTGILWLGQGLRHIDLLTTDNIAFSFYLSYIIMLLPKITSLTIPISIFLAILVNLNRIRTDSELIILWASGESNVSVLLKPIIIFTVPLLFTMLLITLWITPYSLNEIRQKIIEIRSSGINSAILEEKKFISPTEKLTIFIQKSNGDEIENLLIHDLSESDKPQTYIAQKGKFISDNEVKILRLYNGSIQIFNKVDNRISEINFDTYDLDLTPYNKDESKHRYPDELFTIEIHNMLKGKSIDSFNFEEKQQFAEINNRIISPLYILCLSILPLLALTFKNTPSESWVIPIFIVSSLGLLIKVIEISLANLLIDNNNLIYFNYLLPLIILCVLILIITEKIRFIRFK